MRTQSSRQSQVFAMAPISIQVGVAKLVDSAQLYPALKPEW